MLLEHRKEYRFCHLLGALKDPVMYEKALNMLHIWVDGTHWEYDEDTEYDEFEDRVVDGTFFNKVTPISFFCELMDIAESMAESDYDYWEHIVSTLDSEALDRENTVLNSLFIPDLDNTEVLIDLDF